MFPSLGITEDDVLFNATEACQGRLRVTEPRAVWVIDKLRHSALRPRCDSDVYQQEGNNSNVQHQNR